TEGGLDVAGGHNTLRYYVDSLKGEGIRVSLFIEAGPRQLEAAHRIGADIVELHVGAYCDAEDPAKRQNEFERIQKAAALAEDLGLECHAGHGLTFGTVSPIAAIPTIVELNIGHFLIGEAIFTGLETAIGKMRRLMDEARQAVA
ncbi:MAG: pyridoxine 5'-phosphate synthase, partial [Sneathiella sp.]